MCQSRQHTPTVLNNYGLNKSWKRPDGTIQEPVKGTDAFGSLTGSYRLHRCFVDYGGFTDFDIYSHHETMARMYREHRDKPLKFPDGGGGSILLASFVPEDRLMIVNYSTIEPGEYSDGGWLETWSATSSHYKPVTYRWEDLFAGTGNEEDPATPREYADDDPEEETVEAAGTGGGTSNPTMGQ